MEERVQIAIKAIEENNWVEVLRQCQTLKEKYDKLTELLPETRLWSPMPARQLVFYLHQKYNLDFGVCQFYKMDGSKQYCIIYGERIESLCAIPEPYCVNRDNKGQPKYPELLNP